MQNLTTKEWSWDELQDYLASLPPDLRDDMEELAIMYWASTPEQRVQMRAEAERLMQEYLGRRQKEQEPPHN